MNSLLTRYAVHVVTSILQGLRASHCPYVVIRSGGLARDTEHRYWFNIPGPVAPSTLNGACSLHRAVLATNNRTRSVASSGLIRSHTRGLRFRHCCGDFDHCWGDIETGSTLLDLSIDRAVDLKCRLNLVNRDTAWNWFLCSSDTKLILQLLGHMTNSVTTHQS